MVNWFPFICPNKQAVQYASVQQNTYMSDLLAVPRDFLLLVAVRTTVNCISDHDQIARVKRTSTFSDATFSSLNESKNSIMSAAVPVWGTYFTWIFSFVADFEKDLRMLCFRSLYVRG